MKQLDIKIYQQPDAVTCVHTVFRIAADYFGYTFSHQDVLKKLGKSKNGYTLKDAAVKLKKHCNLKHKTLYSVKEICQYIDKGWPIFSSDNFTYLDSHAILIVGHDRNNFSVLDPNTGQITFKDKKFVFEHSDENIVIYKD